MATPSPELEALTLALSELVRDSGATLGAIVDESGVVWSVVPAPAGTDAREAQEHEAQAREANAREAQAREAQAREANAIVDQFFRTEVAPNIKALLHGQRLSIHETSGSLRYVAESFAALYVIALWLEAEFDTELVRARIRLALPLLEALTLAVPPFDGPEGGGAKKLYG